MTLPGLLAALAFALVLGFNEPTIAANPTDPRNLAIADLGLLRVSTDGGGSFSFPVVALLPFATHTFGGDPSLAFDSRGRLRTWVAGGTTSSWTCSSRR